MKQFLEKLSSFLILSLFLFLNGTLFIAVFFMIDIIFDTQFIVFDHSFSETFESDGITFASAPQTREEMEDVVQVMVEEGIYHLAVPYPLGFFSKSSYLEHMELFLDVIENMGIHYPHYSCISTAKVSLRTQQSVLKLEEYIIIYRGGRHSDPVVLQEQEQYFHQYVAQVADILRENDILSLPLLEQIKMIYIYVIDELEYAFDLPEYAFTGYGAITEKKAVCQGYVILFHAICEEFGIEMIGESGYILIDEDMENPPDDISHIWSKCFIEGEWVYFDPTYGDTYGYVDGESSYYNLDYFALSEDEIYLDRVYVP